MDEGARRVLVIEDYQVVAEVESMLASMAGHEVRVAPSGDEGLAAWRELRPDLVVLDLMLPGALSGEQVLDVILEEGGSEARVLVVSALITPELSARLERDPRVETMAKPFNVKELSERIRSLAGGYTA